MKSPCTFWLIVHFKAILIEATNEAIAESLTPVPLRIAGPTLNIALVLWVHLMLCEFAYKAFTI